MRIHVRNSQRTAPRSALVLAILALAFTRSAAAANFNETVVCTGTPQTGQFPSISAALAAATGDPTYTFQSEILINVTGTCTEAVNMVGIQNVNVVGPQTGTPAVLSPPVTGTSGGGNQYGVALSILNSSNITVSNINFVGPGTGTNGTPLAQVTSSNSITFAACNFSASIGAGLSVSSSQVSVLGPTTIQNNSYTGISTTGTANVSIPSSIPQFAVAIQNNGASGIQVGPGGYLYLFDYVTISGNGAVVSANNSGIALAGGTALLCCGPGPNVTNNTGWGISAQQLSSLTIVGTSSGAPNVSISGNTEAGIYSVNSLVGIFNDVLIQGNGDSSDITPLGGIDVLGNGSLQAYGAVIQNNNGPGILVSENSSAVLGLGSVPTTIGGNTGSGIEVQINGSVTFDGTGTTATGNTPKDLTCIAGGIAAEDTGEAPSIGTKSCPNLYDVPPHKHKKG